MFENEPGLRKAMYLFVGGVCLAISLVEGFFASFTSIDIAIGAFTLAVAPLAIGLVCVAARSRIFPALVVFGCMTPVVYVMSIYLNDAIHHPDASTSFIHEASGWWIIAINSLEILIATRRLLQRSKETGATTWPQ